ncbi:MAG: leucine-rich repeat protein [Butyrivibrio sp.]|nr:leucine-rich repeat protein [Butyrivibrio sp.]
MRKGTFKRRFGIIMAFILAVITCVFYMPIRNVNAEQLGDFDCELQDDGTIIITGYDGRSKNVVVPATLDGYRVSGIGDSAFSYTSISRIVIEDGIKSIELDAFRGCKDLSEVVLPQSLESIDDLTFLNCYKLEKISLPSGLKNMGSYVFKGCKSLRAINIPSGDLGGGVFENCESLETVTFGEGVNSIPWGMFEGCIALSKVTISNSITEIGSNAFEECTSLSSIEIPGSVNTIDEYAFSGCTSLTSVKIENGVKTIGNNAFDKTGLTSLSLPPSVTSIGEHAFGFTKGSFGEYKANTTFKVSGVKGSAADKYATDNGMLFVELDAVKDPIISVLSGTYYETQYVELSTETPGATIYYSTDGSTPTSMSSVYSGEIEISESTVLKAIAIKPGIYDSSVVTATYTIREKEIPTINVKNSFVKVVGSKFKIGAKTDSDSKITYTSNKKSVATVNSTGKITCKKTGTATITIRVGETDKYLAATKKIKVKVFTFPSSRKGTYDWTGDGMHYHEWISVKKIKGGKVYITAENASYEGADTGWQESWTLKNYPFEIVGKNKAYNSELGISISWEGNKKIKISGYNDYVSTGIYKKE